MQSIPEALAYYASQPQHADRLCVADVKESFTYLQMWERTYALAVFLKEQCPRGAHVLIPCTQDISFVSSVLAVQMASLVAVPLEGNAAEERCSQIAGETEARFCIGSVKGVEGCKPISPTAAALPSVRGETPAEIIDSVFSIDPSDVAEVLFTTGTTGKSKGIEITHTNNIAIAENIISGVEMRKDNIELIPMPLSHSHGLRTVYANLFNGCGVVLADGILQAKLFFDLLSRYRASALDLSPAILAVMLRLTRGKLAEYRDQIDYVELGSAPLSEEAKHALSELLPDSRLYNFYGSTESGRTCTYDFNHEKKGFGCIGKPARNAVYYFVDEARKPKEAGKDNPGFIATSGAQNMKGYFRAPGLTESIMQNGIIYTTDLGYRDGDGYVFCLGRQDFVINRGGIKISPEEIEEAAAGYAGIMDCACVPAADALQGQAPLLYVEVSNEAGFSKADLMNYLSAKLDTLRLPKMIELIDKIPRAENGKILRAQLMDRCR